MKTILLAVDFSEGIENCCNYAVKVAGRFNAEIILFHSYFDKFLIAESNFPTGIETDTLINRKILQDIKSQAESELDKIGNCIQEAYPEAKVKPALSGGNPEEEIIAAAENFKAGLIILGSSGKAEKGIFSGSVSKRIMENTEIPVLSIPLDYTYRDINNIVYPTEFIHDDHQIIKTIFDLLSKFEFKLHCIHLTHSNKNEINDRAELLHSQFEAEIKRGGFSIEIIESENFTETLHQYIEQKQINLIAFVAHKRSFFKELFIQKLTKKDLFHLHLPMLTIKLND